MIYKIRYKSRGKRRTIRLYGVWLNMRNRCYRKKHHNFQYYGGRGVNVCDEWRHNYHAFREWAIASGYRKGLWLERVDNDLDYSPDNCKWATPAEQNKNRRTREDSIIVQWEGEDTPLCELAQKYGVRTEIVRQRYCRHGWPLRKCLTHPVRSKHGHLRREDAYAAIARRPVL